MANQKLGLATGCFLSILVPLITLDSAHSEGRAPAAKREKVIDFEDEVVEGMNKRPLDSLSQISDAERRRRNSHLYRKRVGFRGEIQESLRQMRYVQ